MKKNNQKSLLLLIAVATLLVVAVGGTLAYLVDATDPVTNTFTPSKVDITIDDTMSGGYKSEVIITNNSTIPVYIRVAVVANWHDDETEAIVETWNPAEHDELPIDTAKWAKNGDYYYYKGEVTSKTVSLFTTGSKYQATDGPSNAHLHMDFIVQAMQTEPASAVIAAWGYIPQ